MGRRTGRHPDCGFQEGASLTISSEDSARSLPWRARAAVVVAPPGDAEATAWAKPKPCATTAEGETSKALGKTRGW